jgi:hypothetical protein
MRSRFVIGGRRPACYPESGVEACALAGRKSLLCFNLLPGQEALHISRWYWTPGCSGDLGIDSKAPWERGNPLPTFTSDSADSERFTQYSNRPDEIPTSTNPCSRTASKSPRKSCTQSNGFVFANPNRLRFRDPQIGFVWRPRNWLRLVPPQTASFRKPQNGFVWQILKSASFGDPETGFVWHPPNWLSFGAPQMASFGEPRNWLRLAQPKLASFGLAPGPRSPAPGPRPPTPCSPLSYPESNARR